MSRNTLVLTGMKQTLKALEQFDKDAVKQFNKVVNTELLGAKNEARSLVKPEPPLSGWATQPARNPRTRGGAGWPAWDQSIIKAGITSTKVEGKVRKDYTTSAGALKNTSAAGVIYEIAGRKGNKAGSFISNLSKKDGPFMPSRLVWHVVDKNGQKIRDNVEDAFNKVKNTLQRNLEKERG